MNQLCTLACKSSRTYFNVQSSVRFYNGHSSMRALREKILAEKDDNDLALEQLDPTLLKPFPEFRNVAAGPVLAKDLYESVWGPYKEIAAPKTLMEPYDKLWEEYVERNGFSPIEYFTSFEFEDRYKGNLLWWDYFRPHKGRIQKQRTRKSCIRHGKISTASPCPLCRDENLLISYKNVPLFNHFIDPYTM